MMMCFGRSCWEGEEVRGAEFEGVGVLSKIAMKKPD
jgi:hypothetical protein